MSKRKVYTKPRIAVEDFVTNSFIAGACQISIKQKEWRTMLQASPLYAEMLTSGYFATGGVSPCDLVYSKGDDILCYHTQGGPLITS
jgi:hypothetical protein